MTTGHTLRAEYAVGADGMHSAVRDASGIGFTGSAYAESFVLADVVMDWAPGREEVSLTFGSAGLTVVAPLPGRALPGRRHRRRRPSRPPTSQFVQQLLDERAPGRATVIALAWSSRFRVHHRVADHYRAGRLLLAGDAAHVHSPAGGQGMNTGIQDGYALGSALATGDLDGYETQRRPVAERVVAFTHRMTRIATSTQPPRPPRAQHRASAARPQSALPHQARHRARRAQLPATLRRHAPIASSDRPPGPVAATPRTCSAVRAQTRAPPARPPGTARSSGYATSPRAHLGRSQKDVGADAWTYPVSVLRRLGVDADALQLGRLGHDVLSEQLLARIGHQSGNGVRS